MKEKLEMLENHLKAIDAPVLRLFHPPIEDEIILVNFIHQHWGDNVNIPKELIELYKWHNGTKVENPESFHIKFGYFADELCLNDLSEVNEIILADSPYNFVEDKLYPFCTSFNGEELAVTLDEQHKVMYCSTSDYEIESVISMYDSLKSFIDTINTFYENSCFIINHRGIIGLAEGKYDTYMRIGEKLNPNSDYWRVKREF